LRPHGVRGELRARLFNPDSEVLFGRETITVRKPDGTEAQLALKQVRPTTAGFVLLTIAGVHDRDAAELLRDALLLVNRSELPEPEEDEFYVHDLVGAQVLLSDGSPVGHVIELRSYPTTDVLIVSDGTRRFEIPLVGAFIEKVDAAAKRVIVTTTEGFES
jgi:16S rRNA processing protein RimM